LTHHEKPVTNLCSSKCASHRCVSADAAFADIATDGEDEVKGVAAIAKRFSNVAGVEILPYHRFGGGTLYKLANPVDP
jgi:hypothetical protein